MRYVGEGHAYNNCSTDPTNEIQIFWEEYGIYWAAEKAKQTTRDLKRLAVTWSQKHLV